MMNKKLCQILCKKQMIADLAKQITKTSLVSDLVITANSKLLKNSFEIIEQEYQQSLTANEKDELTQIISDQVSQIIIFDKVKQFCKNKEYKLALLQAIKN